MATIEIQLNNQVLLRLSQLAEKCQCSLEELIVQILERLGTSTSQDTLMGLFSNEPELLDQIVESALSSRETALF